MDKVMTLVATILIILFITVVITGTIIMYNAIHEKFDTLVTIMITAFILLIVFTFMLGVIGGIL